MRRSICTTEPPFARAGQIATWKFHYTAANALPKGTKLKFDLQSGGRDIDWEVPSIDLKERASVIYLLLDKKEPIAAREIDIPTSIVPHFEFTLPQPVKAGATFTIVIGAPHKSRAPEEECGTACQLTVQRRRSFLLYIDPKGKGNYDEPEIFTMDIRGNLLHSIKVLAPSFVAKNKRFDITVRFEDEYGNLTNGAPEGTLIELSYEHLRENLNWKLFVPETGFVVLPNLYFNEAGIYRIQLYNSHSKERFTSPPIKCFQESDLHLFWGLLHGESERVDSTENIESCLRHFRDEKALNFFATSCFESVEETSNDIWKLISQNVAEFNEEERFITYLGLQYQGEVGKEGLRQILFSKDHRPCARQKDPKFSALTKVYKAFSQKDLISIPTFTMGKGSHTSFKEFCPEYERVVEIYNAWGSSECTKQEGNPRPITGGVEETAEGSLQNALRNNCRFGFVAGGLDDRGIYNEFFNSDQVQYSPGLTAILSEKYTREALFDALYRRACYATTGARIILGFHIAGAIMGSELTSQQKPGLLVNRHLSGYVAGTDLLEKVEIVRNGKTIKTFTPESYKIDYTFDDSEPLQSVLLEGKGRPSFVYYYLRATQRDGHMAWSSPIWIDHVVEAKGGKK